MLGPNEFAWFRVVGYGASGPVRRDPEEAWEAFFRRHRVPAWQHGSFRAATSARLACATTRRAALAADVSATHGCVGRGEWVTDMS